MTRGRKLTAILLPTLLLLGAAVAVSAFGPFWRPSAEVPTTRVERQTFVRRVEADGYLEAVRATQLGPTPSLRRALRIAWMVPDGSVVAEGDPVVRFDAIEMEESLETARDDLTTNRLRIDKEQAESGAQIDNLGRDTQLAELELTSAREFQKKDATLFSKNEILESEIDEELAALKRRHAEQAEATEAELTRAQVDILRIEGRQALAKMEEAEEGLAALEIRAPHDGLVVFHRDWRGNLPRVGDSAYAGNPLAEIPDLSEMRAEVWVLEADAGGLAAGQPVTVVLEAHPERVYEAKVARVDNLAKPRRRGSPVQYFAVTLDLAETDPRRMKPGQRLHATIELDRVEDALVVPRQAVFAEGGERIVFRRRGDGFEPVPVEIGAAGLGRVVVTGGLEDGDEIALADPRRDERPEPAEPEGNGNGASPVGAIGPVAGASAP